MDDLSVQRFMRLFRGNQRSRGVFMPKKPKGRDSRTDGVGPDSDSFERHLSGVEGLGVVPIRDDATCFWGAIDIDNHGQTEDTDIAAVERRVLTLGLPLVPCRSKSGGVHLYLFGSEPLRASLVRKVLARWAKDLNVEGVDCIYPKQSVLAVSADGDRQVGNWINLPYFDADGTGRYAISNGKPVSFDEFLTMAESRAIDAQRLASEFSDDLDGMPPCLRARLSSGGFAPGERNDGIYNVAVFCRKRDPEGSKEAAHDLSMRFMEEAPLPFKERDKTIKSAMGRTYNYKCPAFQDVCNKDQCRKEKYGISEAEYENMAARKAMPVFSGLIKYHNADPVRYDMSMGGEGDKRKITGLTTEQLSSFPEFRKIIMEKTHVVLPRLKGDEWDKILADLFSEVTVEEIPDDATPEGAVRARLEEFCRKADLESTGENATDREALLRGMPVVGIISGLRVIMFRSSDFVSYLHRTKTDAIRNKDLWFKVSKSMDVANARVRVGKTVMPVWYVPADSFSQEEHHVRDYTPEY